MEVIPSFEALINFFGSQPQLLDPKIAWFYNQLTFTKFTEEESIVAQILPADSEMLLEWKRSKSLIGKFHLSRIQKLQLEGSAQTQVLIVSFVKEAALELFKLRFFPQIQIEWGNLSDY